MDIEQIRQAYDFHRQNSDHPDSVREVFPNLVRFINHRYQNGFVIYSNLTEETADRAIEDQVAYFQNLGYEFEWKLMDYDRPADLKERLANHGFQVEEDEAILVMPVEEAPARLFEPVSWDISRVTEPSDLEEMLKFKKIVYPNLDLSWILEEFGGRLVKHPEGISIYLAYLDGKIVASGWTFFWPSSSFAGFYGGATHPDYRGRGLYSAMLAVRLQEVRQRGFRFVNVDAGSMSEPILKRLGFQQIAVSNPCQWSPQKPT